MKMNWSKLPEWIGKPVREKNVRTYFHRNVNLVFTFFTILLLLMQVPWILYLLEPLLNSRVTGLLQFVGLCIPLCIFFVQVIAMIFVADEQTVFFSALDREQGNTRSFWSKFTLYIPVLRYWSLWRMLANSARIPASVMIGGAVMFWVLTVVIGPLSPWVLLSFAVSLGAWLTIAKRLSRDAVKRTQRVWSIALVSMFAVSTMAGYLTFTLTKREINAETRMLQAAGIPTSREEMKRHYDQGRTPNAEFEKFVQRNGDDSALHGSDCLVSASGYYKLPESKRMDLRAYLAGELSREEFKNIDALIESGESLKCELRSPDESGIYVPHVKHYKTIMCYFASRIIVALEEKNPAEAMRLFRLADKFQDIISQSDFLIGALMSIACEHIRSDVIGAMLGSGLLSDANLPELMERNRNREEKIRSAMRNGLCGEAYWIIDTAMRMNVVSYPNILFMFPYDSDSRGTDSLRQFLFRGGMSVCSTPPSLWTEVVQSRYLLSTMRHQLATVRYFEDSASQRDVLRDNLKRALATHESLVERLFLPDFIAMESSFLRIITVSRMTGLGLRIEQFRRKHGRLPETLDELGVKIPEDALSGEPIRYTTGKIKVWDETRGGQVARELPGWQLSAPGRNTSFSAPEQHENRRGTFMVITQWPVPPAPEPPEKELGAESVDLNFTSDNVLKTGMAIL